MEWPSKIMVRRKLGHPVREPREEARNDGASSDPQPSQPPRRPGCGNRLARTVWRRPDRGHRLGSAASAPLRDRLIRQVNRAAEKGTERAAPIIAEAIRTIPVNDALAIMGGGGRTATNFLRGQMGDALLTAMVPGIDEGLRLFDSEVMTTAPRLATGIDFAALRADVTRRASDAIYAQIGTEEAAIRADPRSTSDPLLLAALALARQ
jgi:hypothetical protein